jgi:hypothetical protein
MKFSSVLGIPCRFGFPSRDRGMMCSDWPGCENDERLEFGLELRPVN